MMEVIRKNALECMKKNKPEEANKYIAFGREFLKILHQQNAQFEYPSLKDFVDAFEVMVEKDVNVVDAALAVIAKKQGVDVLSNDNDWDRLKDYAKRINVE
ncbi:PIN domain-containing protein [Acidianus sp. HS-5]|uniref:PIN domain-containing protein n=1 Tax=Acidianus sp. HS-5 TaxID=2886040 RepID=UPI003211BE58